MTKSQAVSPLVGSLGREAVGVENPAPLEGKMGQAWDLAGCGGKSRVILPAFGAWGPRRVVESEKLGRKMVSI